MDIYQARWRVDRYHLCEFVLFVYFFTYITNSRSGQLLVGLIAQLVEHCTGSRLGSAAEVMGSNPV